jgi:hypothetical protein
MGLFGMPERGAAEFGHARYVGDGRLGYQHTECDFASVCEFVFGEGMLSDDLAVSRLRGERSIRNCSLNECHPHR